ncbi:serine/threonine-protein kinase [Streptomyces sp. ISL-98]|uniref:serine/threonine-protein kinase n=1 Tax=Streptomyces sp. ISL-98 TaxID=2819192 RepID=UPI002035BDB3
MGRVWRAFDEILDRRVAVKEMRMDGLDAEDSRIRRERTLREARATARIDHPNVVRVYDVAEENDRLWIVMELVDSRSLEQTLAEEGPLSPQEAARIGMGLVAALREVHTVGVLHRDIKPGNVLLGRAGRVVLTDFGIAAIQDTKALTMAGMLVGSPDYMAPERVGGRPQGPPSDLWSLGATLCAAVAGHSPFSRPTTLATLHAVLYEEPVLPPEAGQLTPVLAALLVKDPALRPDLNALHAALEAIESAEAAAPGRGGSELQEGPPRGVAEALDVLPRGASEAPDTPRGLAEPPQEPLDSPRRGLAESPGGLPVPGADSGRTPAGSRNAAQATVTAAAPAVPRPPRFRKPTSHALVAAVLAAAAVVATVMVLIARDRGGDPVGRTTRTPAPASTSAPTVAGTSRPPTAPPGTRSETGFAWAPPKAWTRSAKSPSNVHYHSPAGQQEIAASYALVRGGDLLAQWQQFERDSQDVPGYSKVRLERTTFQQRPAIVWEYLFTQGGEPWRARQLGFNAGGKSYQLNIWYAAGTRTEALRIYDTVAESFTPL